LPLHNFGLRPKNRYTLVAHFWYKSLHIATYGRTSRATLDGAIKVASHEATTITEFWGLTESWVKDFFDNPDSYIRQYFEISRCCTNVDLANMANDILHNKKNSWANSEDMGKILVILSYIIGASIIREEGESIKWIIRYKDRFLLEISIGDDSKIMDIFSSIADFSKPSFILSDRGFDIISWEKWLKFRERNVHYMNPPSDYYIVR